jgi:tRNA-specific 2-thiouridylase
LYRILEKAPYLVYGLRIMIKVKRKKVFVGLSGGVDSSVSAALLKRSGYDVTGVFIKVWQPDFLPCTWKEDRRDAMRVAAHLNIPFITLDLEKEYKQDVVDYMISEYKKGRTPNPDVMCNRSIKFGAFFKKAVAAGADFVATGHYARVAFGDRGLTQTKRGLTQKKSTGRYTLLAGVDKEKDQSYFLWMLTQKELSKTLFPVGGYKKSEVRKLAKKFGLPTAEKKDSQGLCFMGPLDMKDFLKHFIEEKHGEVLDEKGNVVGFHDGATFFTMGERHGFTITRKGTHDAPYYVVGKDMKRNTITVSHKPLQAHADGVRKNVSLSRVNYIKSGLLQKGKKLKARVRYRQPLEQCTLTHAQGHSAEIIFQKPQLVSPGQSLVFYDREECLGGGIIE